MTATPIFRPILFQPEMVQANLQDRKTMTRRTRGLKKINENPDYWLCNGKMNDDGTFTFASDEFHCEKDIKCPYGKPGDFLYVRESFARLPLGLIDKKNNVRFAYYADYNEECLQITTQDLGLQWKPSIHMPKQAARIFLQVTDVKIERLQEITEGGAFAEGVNLFAEEFKQENPNVQVFKASYVRSFKSLWQKINGPESWDSNPYLWVITYKVISKHGCPEFLKPHFLKTN